MKHEQIALPRPATHFWRAAAATVRAFTEGVAPGVMIARMYPEDQIAPIILRAATTQATLTDPAWAGPLAQLSISQAIEDIVAMTVAGRLARAGALEVDIGRYASVRVPGRAVHAADAGQWVQEGHPIPARQLQILGGPILSPQKLACIVTMTREMTEASNIEAVVRQLLTEAAGLALDAALFSTAAATAAQPAGLLHGLTPLTVSSSTGFDAVGQDLGTLVADIATRGGGARAFFVAAPRQATAIRFYAGGQFYVTPGSDALPVAASAGLADGTVIAIEPESLAFSIAAPEFAVAAETAIHQEDTTPSDIVAGGSQGVSAATVAAGGGGYVVGNTITLSNGVVLTVATLAGSAVATATITNPGSAATPPANPVAQVSTNGAGTGATFNLTWASLGGTGTASTPVKSMFQIDALALRMNVWASWGMRAPHVSCMTGVVW